MSVLDASALLAYLHGEAGGDTVADVLADGARISAANFAETLTKLAEAERRPKDVVEQLREQGILGGLLDVEPLTLDDAIAIAELRPETRKAGLSLGDRACIALGRRLGEPILTADRRWAELDLGADVRAIR